MLGKGWRLRVLSEQEGARLKYNVPKNSRDAASHTSADIARVCIHCNTYYTAGVHQVGQVGTLSNEARLVAADTKATIGRFVDERALFAMDFNHNNTMMAVGGASRKLILLKVDKDGSATPSTLVSEEDMYLDEPKGKQKWKPVPPPAEFSFDDPSSGDEED